MTAYISNIVDVSAYQGQLADLPTKEPHIRKHLLELNPTNVTSVFLLDPPFH